MRRASAMKNNRQNRCRVIPQAPVMQMPSGSMRRFLVVCFLITVMFGSCTKDQGPLIIQPAPIPGDTMISFTRDIQPLFDAMCIRCHNEWHPFLDLRSCCSYEQLLTSGHLAPYVDSLDPENSILIGRLRGVEFPLMPPDGGRVSEGMIDTIKVWILQGARPW